MNKYKEAIEVVDTLLHLMCGEEREDGYKPTMEEMSNSMDLLKELVDKANSLEWIPVSESLPEVLVTIEYEDGTRIVKSSHTTDGKWVLEKRAKLNKCKVVAWKPFHEPYKENVNETR